MKIRNLVSISLLLSGLLAGINSAYADKQRTFGFVGEINSFDRGNNMLVIDDRAFQISDKVRVHKKKGQKATLADIGLGVKVGFYPEKRDDSRQGSFIQSIWVLPANWHGKRGYADNFEE